MAELKAADEQARLAASQTDGAQLRPPPKKPVGPAIRPAELLDAQRHRRLGRLARERTVAGRGFNRWLVPPAALAIHLSIGMAYGFSVFWLPLSQAIGVTGHVACPESMGFWSQVVTTTCDWKISWLNVMYTLFFVFLGSSAAIFGHWLEGAGPRKAGVVAAFCWGGGLLISALGVYLHQIWMLWLGAGVIGGIGLGLGYISPVSTLIKWFPDRRGMATGMAIMGFGGGAMIGAPLADRLMQFFSTPTSVGVWQTFATMGVVYFVAMLCGAFGYRVPPDGWKPEGWTPPAPNQNAMITTRHVHVNQVHRTPQFWLLWAVLCLNVSAGIGVIGMASPMLQEVFGGRLVGGSGDLYSLPESQRMAIATVAAGFAALLSFFNIIGRIFWASLSDYIGRKVTYAIFFGLGVALYAAAPMAGGLGSVALFVAIFCVILTMYGGGFATIPAYLADMFGTRYVGAIHGRLLTAWSVAGILGPSLIAFIRESQIEAGIPAAQAYNTTMYILAAMLVVGLICNLFVRPVHDRHFMSEPDTRRGETPTSQQPAPAEHATPTLGWHASAASWRWVAVAWVLVGIPIVWAVTRTLTAAAALFA
jgi:MFS family permease